MSKSECICAKDCPATEHVTEEVAALRAELEQERDRRHLLVQLREQEGKELEAKLDALRTKCICAKDCPATEHEYPPIEVDETLRELFAKAKTIRGKVSQAVAQWINASGGNA